MSRPSLRLGLAVTAIAIFAALLGATSASAATVVNGDFETGTLEGWSLYQSNPGVRWSAVEYEGEGVLPPPLSGRHAAESEQENPGTTILSQEISLEPGSSHQLELTFGYFSPAPILIPSPDNLAAEGIGAENQQVRIDVMKPTSAITSVAPSDILTTVFASSESENTEGEESEPEMEPRRFTADLDAFAGQTVRLRIAVAVTKAPLHALVDNVSVSSSVLPTPAVVAPQPTPPTVSNGFTVGRLSLNKKTGTGVLSVTLPDAGVLTSIDARRQTAVASLAGSKGKESPVLIKTATVTSRAAGTVKVPIKPTAAALKILKAKGKVSFKVELTFAPTGGTAASQTYLGKLVRTLRPVRR